MNLHSNATCCQSRANAYGSSPYFMKLPVSSVSLLVSVLWFLLCRPVQGAQAAVWDRNTWQHQSSLSVDELPGFKPGPPPTLSRYGGWVERKFRATGFFHTEKARERWWLVDPDGCAFLSAGLCSVNLSTFDSAVVQRTFTNGTVWAEHTAHLLKSAGFNTLGRWSRWELFRPQHPMPYTTTLSFMQSYAKRRATANGERGFPRQCMPVFDPNFQEFCDDYATVLDATKDDPWLLGHFTDNELPFRPDSLTNFLGLPSTDMGHKAAIHWLTEHNITPDRITPKDQEEFLTEVARRYYSTVVTAIRKHDPNHLVIGSRIHGRTICPAVFRGSAPLDVVSINYYHRWSPEPERLTNWMVLSGRPFLVSEWYAMSVQPDKIPQTGAGFRVRTDAERGLFYQNMTLGLLRHPGCVGWHWFKYGGDEPGIHKGLVNLQFTPHQPLLDRMKHLNAQLYRLAEHYQHSTTKMAPEPVNKPAAVQRGSSSR